MSPTATLCDACHMRAVIRYHRTEDDTFHMCEHHGRQHHAALTALGYTRQTLEAMAVSG